MKVQSTPRGILSCPNTTILLVFILQLFACSLRGQVLQKKTLSVADYSQWGTLRLDKMNASGEWVSYTMSYENGADTLFVKNTRSLETQAFPLGSNGNFITPGWFTCQTANGLHIVDLKTGRQEIVPAVIQYMYAPAAKKLLVLIKEEKGNTLIIRNPDGSSEERLDGMNEFKMDPTSQTLLYTTTIPDNQHTINLLALSQKNQKTILLSGSGSFSDLVWHKKGKALAFIQKSFDASGRPGNTVFYYGLSDKKLYHTNSETQHSFLGDCFIIPTLRYELKISDDLQKVFFAAQRRTKSKDSIKDSDVQLWYGNARWIYPREEKRSKETYLALWHPVEDRYQLISNDTFPQVMLTGDQKYAIVSNTQLYEPQYDYDGKRDFYEVDLSTGQSKLLLKKHPDDLRTMVPSPAGKYITYFQEKNWWVYDILKKTHTNITKNIGQSFFHNKNEHPNVDEPYSNVCWTVLDKEIILCDEYDIWAIGPDGASARRLTHGRENQVVFRLPYHSSFENYDGWISETVDLNKGLLLEARDKKGGVGYYKWSLKSNDKLVFSTNSYLNQLICSASGNVFAYMEQRYDLSPRLMINTNVDKSSQVIVQSNPQHQRFHWGKSELIQYKNVKGKSLQGILYYPADYNNQKKYPMIVCIYEKLTQNLFNKYSYPSQFTGEDEAVNIAAFTTQGYFVLAPDISYNIGDPGVSATDCVVSATNEVIAQGLVQPNKIGLMGHSFGGYETDFIITQTNLFAAAAAGAAATDLTSFYLTVGWNTGRPDMWRFESQQWRMGKSLFEDRAGYDRNSPIQHVENITTPLLSWTGGEDKQVDWHQSIEFYLALRRLKKPHIMLLYPKERHGFTNSKNLKDLSIRVHEWFDYHLKDESPAEWIITGLK